MRIKKTPFLIGRSWTNDLRLENPEMSRVHAEITETGDGFALRDLDSRSGIFVNGAVVDEHRLVHGDRVKFGGKTELVFLLSDLPAVPELRHQIRALLADKALDDLLPVVIDLALSLGGADAGCILLAGDDQELAFKVGRFRGEHTRPASRFDVGREIAEEVFRTGLPRVETVDRTPRSTAGTVGGDIRAVWSTPLQLPRDGELSGRRLGVLYLEHYTLGGSLLHSDEAHAELTVLVDEAVVAIDEAQSE